MFTPSTASHFLVNIKQSAIIQDWESLKLGAKAAWKILNTPLF